MRSVLVLLLLFLAACGGGGDSTAPPAETFFHVGVTGQGTGAGRIGATASGGNLDCPSPTPSPCGSSYREGTAIQFSTTPDAQSVFDRWGLDAQPCGAQPTCSMTVDRALTIQATFTATPYPAVAGIYNVTGTFDNLAPSTAFFDGTLTLTQASRTDGALGGAAALLVRLGTQVFNITEDVLESGNVSPTGVVAFTLRGTTTTWTFTGTHSGSTIVSGRHSLASPGTTAQSGSWNGTRVSGIRMLAVPGPNQLEAMRAHLQR